MKLYVDFLSKQTETKKISVFYKAAIGQLILCRNVKSASTVLRAIFIAATGETDGQLLG